MKRLPEYKGVRIGQARSVIRKHYGLTRLPSDSEVRAEIDNLLRKRAAMSLDDKASHLAAALHLA